MQLSLTTWANQASFQQTAVVNSFTVSAIAVLARWLKMDAEETRVL
jgi:hypothetical protein